MFDSMLDHKDLVFQDATVRLITVPAEDQNYADYLGPRFMRAMDRMEIIDCITTAGATSNKYNMFIGLIATLSVLVHQYL